MMVNLQTRRRISSRSLAHSVCVQPPARTPRPFWVKSNTRVPIHCVSSWQALHASSFNNHIAYSRSLSLLRDGSQQTGHKVTTDKDSKLEIAQKVIGYDFNDPDILWEALQAAGNGASSVRFRTIFEGNKRLAMLGDAVQKLELIRGLYEKGLSRVEMNAIIEPIVENRNLANQCDSIGLTSCININLSQHGYVGTNTKAATMEAVAGAAYLDGGLDAAARVMKNLGMA
ncbi:ribonuclease III domain-containing protein [Truncatella angustata]|uniref:Ribonuclease III domain-containing protein n=1 Tax=Truncatella angustata TaxID=152316 RepID=A0A9P8UPW3_9PEZI|nr:ribonuclease III domain-containing protein [Truncatella angustata]KAH6656052.1 ribonuclease III domain-containing protein [Truncatella angustata]KAH8198400.1 hypothetical protein TruAng_007435 [Truncatella angustata]